MNKLEARMAKIPEPFVLMYRPPGKEHQKINVVLDDLHNRLNMLECHCTDQGHEKSC